MRIVIHSFGTRGDLAPFTGLGARLQQAGHEVAIGVHESFAPMVRAAGLEHRPLAGDVRALLAGDTGRELERGGTGVRWMTRMMSKASSYDDEWLFPRMAAVVHHGGAGTTGAGLRAGVPAVAVTALGDQPFWGERMTRAGVSPGWTTLNSLTAERLAELVGAAVTDPGYRRRARELAEGIATEDGAGRVVDVVNRMGK